MSTEPKLVDSAPDSRPPSRPASSQDVVEELGQKTAPISYPDGGLKAWLVAAGTASIMFSTLGYTNSFGVFQAFYMENQLRAEGPSKIAWIGSLQTFLMFATGSIGGPLFDRYGAKIIWPSAVVYLFAVMITSLCKEYWQFMLAQGLLTGFADGLLVFPSMAATPQYFYKKRGAAMGIAIAGSSVGGIVFPIILAKMLNESSLGFGWSVRICGFVMVPFLAFSCATVKSRLPPRRTNFFLASAFRKWLFNSLIAAQFCLMVGMFIPLIFMPSFAITRGMAPVLASYLVAMLNGASIFGRVIPGILADKFGRLNMLAAAGLSTALLALVWFKVEGTAGIIVFSVVFGFCSGAIISGGSVALSMCPEDPSDTGTYLGQGMAMASMATLVGPPVAGALLDKNDGFVLISIFSGVFTLVGGLIVVCSKIATPKGIFGKV